MKRMRLLALLAGSVLLWPLVASAQNGGLKFTLTDLGTFGGYQSEAFAINNSGQIVGDYLWTFKRLRGQACFSQPAGQAAALFGSWCTARAVNSSGFVAGWMDFPGGTHAFRRAPTGGAITELLPASGTISHGYGIDDSLDVVGDDADTLNPTQGRDALRWKPGNSPTVLAHCYWGTVYATTSNGSVVGGVCDDPSLWVNLWGSPIQVPLSRLGCNGAAEVWALNASAHAVGGSSAADCSIHAVLWGQNGVVDLAALAYAFAISSDDWIVGVYQAGAGAFLRVSDPACPQAANLNLLLDSSGTGWSVTAAYGINDSHQIVGQGLAPNGQFHAILLTQANKLPLCKPV